MALYCQSLADHGLTLDTKVRDPYIHCNLSVLRHPTGKELIFRGRGSFYKCLNIFTGKLAYVRIKRSYLFFFLSLFVLLLLGDSGVWLGFVCLLSLCSPDWPGTGPTLLVILLP